MKTAPSITVVVPVHNGGELFRSCLQALVESDYCDYEIIVVDDASTDSSAELARSLGISVLQLTAQRGPAAARNCGAAKASGAVIVFVDADVVVRRDTLERIGALFNDEPDCAAVFGSYDTAPSEQDFVSQYKNLLHHFVHQQGSREAVTFWAGCGAIRREAIEAVGGFDDQRYETPSIEDIELGQRLRRKGFRIILDNQLQVQHLKRWTFVSLLRTDILQRALPWSRLILEDGGMINDLNLRVADRISAGLVWLAICFLPLSYFSTTYMIPSAIALMIVLALNLRFYHFLKELRGNRFALQAFGMLLLHYSYSAAVFAICYCIYGVRKILNLKVPSREQGQV